jgi:outer membrane protein OmpA-like peptidoglycan-associated protein
MKNPFLFEAEEYEDESQYEDSFESFEDEFEDEGDYEFEDEADQEFEDEAEESYEFEDEFEDEEGYEFEDEGDLESDFEFEGEGNYEFEGEGDYEFETPRRGGRRISVRDHRTPLRNRISRPAVRDHRSKIPSRYQHPMSRPRYQGFNVFPRYRQLNARPYYQRRRFHPNYQSLQRARSRRRQFPALASSTSYPYFNNTFGSASQSVHKSKEWIRMMQSFLNRVLGSNLPVDGIMNIETRNAIRRFLNQRNSFADGAVDQPTEPDNDSGASQSEPFNQTGDDKDVAQGEEDEFEFSDFETSRTPWRDRMGLRPKPQYLRFLSIDNFGIDKSVLTNYQNQMLDNLVRTIEASWKTMQPIDLIRLVGHTDSTGKEKYNIGLGERRASAVEEALKMKMRRFTDRVAVVVEPSPGETKPTADNRTQSGRARNRRVEIFITSGGLPPKPAPPKKIKLFPTELPPESVIRTKPNPYTQKIPTLPPGKTFKQWFFEQMEKYRVPKFLRNKIWNAFLDKNSGLLSSLLNTAGIRGAVKDAFLETARALAESPTR